MGDKKKEGIVKNFEIPRMARSINIPQQKKVPKMPPVDPPKKDSK